MNDMKEGLRLLRALQLHAEKGNLRERLPAESAVIHLEPNAGEDLAGGVADRVGFGRGCVVRLELADLIPKDLLKIPQGHGSGCGHAVS